MSNFNPNISQLFNIAFGFTPIVYKINNTATSETSNRMSWMGTPVMFPIAFKGGTYKQYNSTGVIENKTLPTFNLPDTTVADFRRAKNITKTNVLGNNGTVKEIYGFDDWQIRLRGFCLDTPSLQAHTLKQELLKWENLADSITVVGSLFTEKSIYKISIESIDFKQPVGRHNVIPFEISASSDSPLELEQL